MKSSSKKSSAKERNCSSPLISKSNLNENENSYMGDSFSNNGSPTKKSVNNGGVGSS